MPSTFPTTSTSSLPAQPPFSTAVTDAPFRPATSPTAPNTHARVPNHGSLVLPSSNNSTSMLLLWAYDTRNVTVNEKLHRDAFLAVYKRGNDGGAGGAGGR